MKKLALAVCLSLGLTYMAAPADLLVQNVMAAEQTDESAVTLEEDTSDVMSDETSGGAAEELDATYNGVSESQLIGAAEDLVTTMVNQQEQVEQYLAMQPNEAVQGMLDAWIAMKDEVGAFKEMGETTVSEGDGKVTVKSEVIFENASAELVVNFDEQTWGYDSISFDKIQTFAEKMSDAGMNTIIGLCTVFAMLIVMSLLISCFKFISKLDPSNRKKPQVAEPAAAPAPAAASEVVEEETDDGELLAVISAAIAAYEAASGTSSADGFVVRSIKKRKR